jgi:hypothetical protein
MEMLAFEKRFPYFLWLEPPGLRSWSCEERARKRDERCDGQPWSAKTEQIDANVAEIDGIKMGASRDRYHTLSGMPDLPACFTAPVDGRFCGVG